MKKNKNVVHVLFIGIKLCFLIAIGMGMAVFLAEFVGIQSYWTKLLPPVLLSAVICGAVLFLVPSGIACVIIAAALWLIFFLINKADIYGGAQTVSVIAEDIVTAYFDNIRVQRTVLTGGSLKQMLHFLTAVLSAWQGLTVFVNFRKSRPALTALLPALAMILYFAVGQVPHWCAMILFGIGFIGLRSLNTGADKNYRAALKSAVVSVVLFAAVTGTVAWAMPSEGYLKKEDKTHIRTAIRDSYRDFGEYLNERVFDPSESHMGIGEGRLDKAGDLSYTGQTVMRVSMNRQVPASIYLKAYAAGNFESNRWEETDAAGLDEISADYDANTNEYLKSIWNNSYQAVFSGSDTVMTISPTEALMPGHLYVPYAALLGSGDKMTAEGYMTGLAGGQKRKIFYAADFFSLMSDADSYIGAGAGGGRLKSYTKYVRENYMSAEGMSERFKKDYKIADGSSLGSVTAYIKKKFEGEHIHYTLEPGHMPRGGNVIDYFLYENKKGYCMHFASAAVMIYRLNGIPARYAEGYVLPRGSFKQHSSGYENGGSPEFVSEIRDYQAHAWPEIYIEDFGWVPAEVTPAYTNGSIPEALTAQSETETSGHEASETETSGQEASETEVSGQEASETEASGQEASETEASGQEASETKTSENGGSLGSGTDKSSGGSSFQLPAAVWRTILVVFAAAIFGIGAAAIVKFRLHRAAALLKQPYGSQTAGALWRYLMRWLTLYGVSSAKNGDSERILKEISEKAGHMKKQKAYREEEKAKDNHVPDEQALSYVLDEQALSFVLDKLLKASYSKQGLDDEEYGRVITLYRQLAKSIYGQLSFFKKMAALFLWCLPGRETDHV